MSRIVKYTNKHHFNKYSIVHEYRPDNTLIRKWVDKNDNVVEVYDFNDNLNIKQLETDIWRCFMITGTIFKADQIPFETLESIYETKLPYIKSINQYDVGMVCTGVVERLKTYKEIKPVPKTYYELFSIIGVERDWNDNESIIKKNGDKEYIIYIHPDSVYLEMDIIDNNIYFGYRR